MAAPLKILVLNDDSLSATTIYDQVQTQGFKVLNGAVTKEIYHRHHSYNTLLSNESCLGEQLVFEPSDFYAPKIQVSPAFLQSLQVFSAAKKPQFKADDIQIPTSQSDKQQSEPESKTESKIESSTGNLKTELPSSLNNELSNDSLKSESSTSSLTEHFFSEGASLSKSTLENAPLKVEECTWWKHTLFFTLTDYTILEKGFITQHFDGILFFMHHPLGSKALPERLINLLLSREKLKLWVFNVQFDTKQINYAFKQLQNQLSIDVLQSLQEIEQRQLQVFLNELLPRAEFVGCLDHSTYQQLQAFYALQKQQTEQDTTCQTAVVPQPVMGVVHNAYQYLHYVNQVRSMCSTALGLATQFTRDCILSAHPDVLSYENLEPEFIRSLRGGKITRLHTCKAPSSRENLQTSGHKSRLDKAKHNSRLEVTENKSSLEVVETKLGTGETKQQATLDKLNVLSNNDSIIQESTIAQYPKSLFSCAVERRVNSYTLGNPVFQHNAASDEHLTRNLTSECMPHFVISSRHFNFNQILGMELAGVRLILQTLAVFPQARISLVFNECVYSWLEQLAKNTILFQDLSELQTEDPFTQAAKDTHELLSLAMQSRVVNNLRQHIQASFADVEHWPWTYEQKANLEVVLQRLSSSESSNIFCYQNLSDKILALPIDLVCSDRQADLVKARSTGIAALELVDSASIRCKSFNQYSADYLEGFAKSCDFEQASFIRFITPQLLNNAKHQYNLLSSLQQEQNEVELELAATVQAVLHLDPQSSKSSLSQDNSSVVSNECLAAHKVNTLLHFSSGMSTAVQCLNSSRFGFTYGLSLSWDCIMDSMNWLEYVCGFSTLKEQVSRCFTEHIKFLRYLTASFSPLLEQKVLTEQRDLVIKTAQLSNYTYTKRYNLHYQGLRFIAQLSHAKGFGDGATLAEKLSDCEFASAFLSHRCTLPQQSLNKAAYQWPVFKPLSLSVLSFGCSRGDEIFDLLQLFNGQRLTGIDINQSAILDAQQQLLNLPHIPLEQAAAKFSELYALPLQVFSTPHASDSSSTTKNTLESNVIPKGMCSGANVNQDKVTVFTAELENSIAQAVQQLKDEVFTPQTCAKRNYSQENIASEKIANSFAQQHLAYAKEQTEQVKSSVETTAAFKLSEAAKPQLVQYLGAMGLINFVNAQDFFKQHQDNLPQFDVVTVMTVLCRHPDTMHARSAQGIYSFEDFVQTIEMIDRMVKQGGLLCIFNSNYSLLDTPVGFKYQGVFPQLPGVKAEDANMELASLAQHYLQSSEQVMTQSSNQISDLSPSSKVNATSTLSASVLPLPDGLYKTLQQTSLGEILGHVAMFKPDGKLNPQGRKGCMSIYYKTSV